MFTIKEVTRNNIFHIDELTIPGNKVTCILGQSGSGKSTFIRLLNNLDNPDAGEILYLSKSIMQIEPIELRRKIIMVPQNPVVFDGTIRDNLLIGLRFSEKPLKTDEQMINVLKQMYLDKNLNDSAGNLSGGEKQRLALARVILMDPNVFLLDEPSSALDEETAELVIQSFVDLAKTSGKTVIMVTHAKEIAEKMGENIIYMDKYSLVLKRKGV